MQNSEEKMKKYTIVPGENKLRLDDAVSVALGEFDVKVKVKALSLNYRDILNMHYANQEVIPFSDGSGEVIAVGTGVSNLKVGDPVVGLFFPTWTDGPINQAINGVARGGENTDGMLATEVVGHQDSFLSFPEYLSYEQASTLPCAALTAWHAMFEHAQPALAGQTILLQGTGGVSIFALQLAAAHNINTIVISSSDEKLARAKELGATHTINYRSTPDWDAQALQITKGKGVDMVLEVGGAGTIEKSMNALKVAGVLSMIGVLTGLEAKINPLPIVGKSLRVFGIYVGSRAMQINLHKALAEHHITPIIDKVFDFDEAEEAYKYQSSAQHLGKIVVKIA